MKIAPATAGVIFLMDIENMHVEDLLKIEYIVEALMSPDKASVLRELAEVLSRHQNDIDAEAMTRVLLGRESLGSTGIGDGIAIPHGKMPTLKEPLIAFGRSRAGIPFDSLDGKPAHLFFVVMAPEKTTGIHLKLLARLSRMLKDKGFRDELFNAQTAEELLDAIVRKEKSLKT